jgi:hypothetical protein
LALKIKGARIASDRALSTVGKSIDVNLGKESNITDQIIPEAKSLLLGVACLAEDAIFFNVTFATIARAGLTIRGLSVDDLDVPVPAGGESAEIV